jgi:hypothetical protein
VRGFEERFESQVLPLFKRRTPAVESLLREFDLHGWSRGDFDLAWRLDEPLIGRSVVCGDGRLRVWASLWCRKQSLKDAAASIGEDCSRMVTLYDFPAEHGRTLRTSNVIEPPIAALRLRTGAARRFKKIEHATAVIFKLLPIAAKTFRELNAPELMQGLFHSAKYMDGKRSKTHHQGAAA